MKNMISNKFPFNEFYSNMMQYFNATLCQMNNFKEILKSRDKELRESYIVICKNFIDTRDFFQKFYSSINDLIVF